MPRRVRIPSAGIVYHVLNRSVKQLVLFSSDWDYASFEELLFDAKQRAAVKLFDYLSDAEPLAFRFLCLKGRRAIAIHALVDGHACATLTAFHETVGTGAVYQGRFKAIPIQSDVPFSNRMPIR